MNRKHLWLTHLPAAAALAFTLALPLTASADNGKGNGNGNGQSASQPAPKQEQKHEQKQETKQEQKQESKAPDAKEAASQQTQRPAQPASQTTNPSATSDQGKTMGNSHSNPDGSGVDKPFSAAGQGHDTQPKVADTSIFSDGNNGCGQDKKVEPRETLPSGKDGWDDNNGWCGPHKVKAAEEEETHTPPVEVQGVTAAPETVTICRNERLMTVEKEAVHAGDVLPNANGECGVHVSPPADQHEEQHAEEQHQEQSVWLTVCRLQGSTFAPVTVPEGIAKQLLSQGAVAPMPNGQCAQPVVVVTSTCECAPAVVATTSSPSSPANDTSSSPSNQTPPVNTSTSTPHSVSEQGPATPNGNANERAAETPNRAETAAVETAGVVATGTETEAESVESAAEANAEAAETAVTPATPATAGVTNEVEESQPESAPLASLPTYPSAEEVAGVQAPGSPPPAQSARPQQAVENETETAGVQAAGNPVISFLPSTGEPALDLALLALIPGAFAGAGLVLTRYAGRRRRA